VSTFEAHRLCVETVTANFARLSLDESYEGLRLPIFLMESRQFGCGAGRETASGWNVSGERLFMSSAAALPSMVLSTSQVSDARGHKLANNMCYHQASGQKPGSGMGSPNAGKEVPAAPR
jgi:hypothetical protein